MTDALAAWLLEQIAEDERVARAAEPDHPRLWGRFSGEAFDVHIARWQPHRALAECDAKRRLIQRVQRWPMRPPPPSSVDDVLEMLALPYADRPGYRDEWRP